MVPRTSVIATIAAVSATAEPAPAPAKESRALGVEASIVVKPSYGLSDDEISSMLSDSMTHSKDDAVRRALKEAQVEAQRLIEAVQAALKSDGELLSDEETRQVSAAIAALQVAALGEDRRAISASMNALELATKDFAARRMDKSIRQAFAGRRIEEIEAVTTHDGAAPGVSS